MSLKDESAAEVERNEVARESEINPYAAPRIDSAGLAALPAEIDTLIKALSRY